MSSGLKYFFAGLHAGQMVKERAKINSGKPVTITLSKNTSKPFNRWDIIYFDHMRQWSIVTEEPKHSETPVEHTYILALFKINAFKWRWFRNIQFWIIRYTFKK